MDRTTHTLNSQRRIIAVVDGRLSLTKGISLAAGSALAAALIAGSASAAPWPTHHVVQHLVPASLPNQELSERITALLNEMLGTDGYAYIRARDQLLALGPDASMWITDRASKSQWDAKTWEHDALISIVQAWFANPTACQRFYHLTSLQPSFYLAQRRPEPETSRELLRMARDQEGHATLQAAILVELLTKTGAVYAFTAAKDFPSTVSANQIPNLQARERRALHEGVISALGRSGHLAAPFALANVVNDRNQSPVVRQTAAVALGQTGTEYAYNVLTAVSNDTSAPIDLQGAALRGLGSVRTDASLEVLMAYLGNTTANVGSDASVRTMAAVSGIGTFASTWAANTAALSLRPSNTHQDTTHVLADARLRGAQALIALLLRDGYGAHQEEIITSLVMLGDQNTLHMLDDQLRQPNSTRSWSAQKRLVQARSRLATSLRRMPVR